MRMGWFPDVDFVVKLKKPNYTSVFSSTLTGHFWLFFGQAITLCRSVLISNKGLHSVTHMARTQPQWLTTCKSGCCVTSSTFTFSIHQVLQQNKRLLLSLFDYSYRNRATGSRFVYNLNILSYRCAYKGNNRSGLSVGVLHSLQYIISYLSFVHAFCLIFLY